MAPLDRSLLRKLVVAVLLKLVVLTILWWAFVRDHRVAVDPEWVTSILFSSPSQGDSP
ncbi:cytochrome oxidase putative small subunit CydP [Candidatus Symbiobacter mobilis]|uniref:Uncharacterized protein n=1 Tax=Candidatus Symbiobacter mobilis CR TaxID=946483 RepID=U5N4N4_9BURK|nr:hypothetical protein Cenrod_0317 [Candidatus Symbiobacter mobilis CR]